MFTLVPAVGAQVVTEVDRSTIETELPSRSDRPLSAVEQLHAAGIIPDFQFAVEDLAKLPASSWPAGLSYDSLTGEVAFVGERLAVRHARASKAAARDRSAQTRAPGTSEVVYEETKFVGRLSFTDSFVSENGDITLSGPNGYLQLSATDDDQMSLLVHPLLDQEDAFYPTKYVVDIAMIDFEQDLGDIGTVACCDSSGDSGYLRCKCDTTGGGSCDKDKCDTIKTCGGGFGSCAWTAAM